MGTREIAFKSLGCGGHMMFKNLLRRIGLRRRSKHKHPNASAITIVRLAKNLFDSAFQ